MPADKDAAKRRRQARNRQERQNRQARTEGAKRASTRPSRTATETPAKASTGTTSLAKAPARPAAAPGGLLGKLFPPRSEAATGPNGRPARPARPPSEVVDVEDASGARGLLDRFLAQPGGRATVVALAAAAVCAVALFIFPVAPPPVFDGYGTSVVRAQAEAAGGDRAAVAEAEEEFADGDLVFAEDRATLLELVPPPVAVVYALVPLLIAGMAVRALVRPTRSRTLLICAITGVLYVVMTGPIGMFFVPGVLALGFAAYQSSKADKAAVAAAA